MIEIKIDGKVCECEKNEYLLDVARRNGFEIPTLCHHPALPGQASCRLCIVEVVDRGWHKIVVSCVFPVEKPIEVYTDSERVRKDRAMVLMLLAKRAPESDTIKALCEKYGAAEGDRFAAIDGEKCVMCGLCAQACKALGTGAISTVGRGTEKKISTPYDEPSQDCIGCLSCANICPTKAIDFTDGKDRRFIWGRPFRKIFCKRCGAEIGTWAEVQHAAKRSGEKPEELCPVCRQKAITDTMAQTYGAAEFEIDSKIK